MIVTLEKKEGTQILKSSNCSGLFLSTQKQKVPWQFSLWQLRDDTFKTCLFSAALI